mgnify:CR=1 FL=1
MLTGTTHAGALSLKVFAGGSVGGSWSSTGDGHGFFYMNVGVGIGASLSLEYQYQYTPGYKPIWQW